MVIQKHMISVWVNWAYSLPKNTNKQTKTKLDVMICIGTLCWRLDYVWIVKADFISGSIHWSVQNWWHYFKMMKTGRAWLEQVGHWGPFEDMPCFWPFLLTLCFLFLKTEWLITCSPVICLTTAKSVCTETSETLNPNKSFFLVSCFPQVLS